MHAVDLLPMAGPFLAGRDPQLGEDVAKVPFDRTRADKQLPGIPGLVSPSLARPTICSSWELRYVTVSTMCWRAVSPVA